MSGDVLPMKLTISQGSCFTRHLVRFWLGEGRLNRLRRSSCRLLLGLSGGWDWAIAAGHAGRLTRAQKRLFRPDWWGKLAG